MKYNDNAVSPVIGVIVMVAVTVILAAIIAAFVFGMAQGIQKDPYVAVVAYPIEDSVVLVSYQGGPNHQQCTKITATIFPETEFSQIKTLDNPKAGQILTFIGVPATKNRHVVVTATFSSSVFHQKITKVLDTYV